MEATMQANFLCDFHPSSFFKSMNVDERQSLFTEKSESFKNEIVIKHFALQNLR